MRRPMDWWRLGCGYPMRPPRGWSKPGLPTSELAALGFTPRGCATTRPVCAEEQKHREEPKPFGSYSCALLFVSTFGPPSREATHPPRSQSSG